MEQETPARSAPEAEVVFASRMAHFLALGFTELEAELLAESNVDWHYVADRLIDRGCDTRLAFEIAI